MACHPSYDPSGPTAAVLFSIQRLPAGAVGGSPADPPWHDTIYDPASPLCLKKQRLFPQGTDSAVRNPQTKAHDRAKQNANR